MAAYPYIRAHGALMGSNPSYIDDQIAKARRLRAPAGTFTFKRPYGQLDGPIDVPVTIEDLEGGITLAGVTAERLRNMASQQRGASSG